MNSSNALYTSVEHFRSETKIQAKFFNKLTLNQYRTAISNRYGFKSIKLFEDSLNKIIVTVVAYETLGSSGGFDWFKSKEDAEKYFESEKFEGLEYNSQFSIFDVEIDSYDTAIEDIEHKDYAGLADNAEIMFPYPLDVWKEIVEKYNKQSSLEDLLTTEQLKVIKNIYEQAKLVESALNIFNSEGGSKDSFNNDEYGEYLERLSNLKKMLTNTNINQKIIKNVIKDLKLYPDDISKEEEKFLIHTKVMVQESINKHQDFVKSIGGKVQGYQNYTDITQRYMFDNINQRLKFQEYLKEQNIPFEIKS